MVFEEKQKGTTAAVYKNMNDIILQKSRGETYSHWLFPSHSDQLRAGTEPVRELQRLFQLTECSID